MLLLSQIRYQDLLDIALCSYIMFRFYVLFRGTNVFMVLIGIAFLWVFKVIAVWSGLIVTSYVIQAITALAAIIIIVVFRNEIRSSLQATNLKMLLWGFPRHTEKTPTALIVESAFELARKRIGGLIVIPGKEDIKDHIHSGIRFDALVSTESIISVFWKGNPVHDGAMIISGNRIVEVSAILPLTKRQDLPSFYGTRHRAAVGLGEVTDALIIAVSEERGSVLVIKGSQLVDILQPEDLLRLLNERAGYQFKKGRFLENEKFRLGFAAFVSVVFVSGAWFNLTKGLDTLTTVQIPIEYKNRNPRMEISGTSVDSVRLFLKGSEALLKSIRVENLKAEIDVGSGVVGENVFEISRKNIALPPGITLNDVQPPVVSVILDIQAAKELPVQVDWTGKLREDLILVSAQVYPQKVNVYGVSLILKEINTIFTESVLLDPLKQSGDMQIKLILPSSNITFLPEYDGNVRVTYVIKKRQSE